MGEEVGSVVRVYNNDALDYMLSNDEGSGNDNFMQMVKGNQKKKRLEEARRQNKREEEMSQMKQKAEEKARLMDRRRQQLKELQEEAEQSVRNKILEQQARRERKSVELQSEIELGNKLAAEIQARLSLKERDQKTKLKKQYDEWETNVYGNIQQQIQDQLNSVSHQKRNQRRRADFQKFLDTNNAKRGAIFRDIIIESEYDPLEPNRNCPKVNTSHIADPLRRVLDKQLEEDLTLSSTTGSSLQAQRQKNKAKGATRPDMLQVTDWASGRIEATPHGYFAKIMDSSATSLSPSRQSSKTYSSNIPCFDHFNVPRGSHLVKAELPPGKRAFKVPNNIVSLA